MKKLNTRETFAGTSIDVLNEAGDVLTSIDYLSFGANKMDAKLFAGQIVNAWNGTYGEGVDPGAVPGLLSKAKGMIQDIEHYSKVSIPPSSTAINALKEAIKKAQPE